MRLIDADALELVLNNAIEMMRTMAKVLDSEDDPEIQMEIKAYTDILTGVKEQPTAQPERKRGHWILVHPLQEDDTGAYMCSECKVGKWEIDPKSYFFCPNCGADMRGEQDEAD